MASVHSLDEFRLHRDCEKLAWRLPSGNVVIDFTDPITLPPDLARTLAESMNDSLSRKGTWECGSFVIRRASLKGMVWVSSPFGDVYLRQEKAELYALALARAVGP